MSEIITKEHFNKIISRIQKDKEKVLDEFNYNLFDIVTAEGIETDYETYVTNKKNDIDETQVNMVRKYITQNWRTPTSSKKARMINSYSLKHTIESTCNTYISNGACIKWVLLERYKIAKVSSLNCFILFDFYWEEYK